jgi:hypothetical protein
MKKIWILILVVISFACCPVVGLNLQATTVAPTQEGINTVSADPCENPGHKYRYDPALGEIKEEYIGSWHSSPFVGSAHTERFVFFPTGNYLFFPSEYECSYNDESCIPSPIEEGIWGVQGGQLNLAKGGDINNVRSILIGPVVASSPDESPYPLETTFDGTTYWLMTTDTDMWNPETGEMCY